MFLAMETMSALGWNILWNAGPNVVEDSKEELGFTFDFGLLVGLCLIVLKEGEENIPGLILSDPRTLGDLLRGTPFERKEGDTLHLLAPSLHDEVIRPFLSKILGSSI
jgi:hypothetical protein